MSFSGNLELMTPVRSSARLLLTFHSHMKTRIGLVSNQGRLGRSITHYVEVTDAKELAAELTKLNAKQAVLYFRDRIGDGHTEGNPFPVASVGDKEFKWAADVPKDGMRGIFFDTK